MKYKTKRRAAGSKLEATEQNLLRIRDVIAEVERQRNSLKRQANKAERYKQLDVRATELKLFLKFREHAALWEEFQALLGRLGPAQQILTGVRAGIGSTEAVAGRAPLAGPGRRAGRHRRARGALRGAQPHRPGRGRTPESRASRSRTPTGAGSETQAALTALGETAQRLIAAIQAGSTAAAEQEREVAALEARAGGGGAGAARDRGHPRRGRRRPRSTAPPGDPPIGPAGPQAERAGHAPGAQPPDDGAGRAAAPAASRGRQPARGRRGILHRRGDPSPGDDRAPAPRPGGSRGGAGRGGARARGPPTSGEPRSPASSPMSSASGAGWAPCASCGWSSPISRRATSCSSRRGGTGAVGGVLGPLAEVLETAPRHEKALEAILGTHLQGVRVQTWAEAQEALAHLFRSGQGRATLVGPTPTGEGTWGHTLPRRACGAARRPAQGTAGRASRGWRWIWSSPPKAPQPWVTHLLADAVIVSDLDTALAVARELTGPFTLATLAGEVLTHRGTLTGGTPAPQGLLAQRRELRELEEALAISEVGLSGLREALAIVSDDVASAERAVETRRHGRAAGGAGPPGHREGPGRPARRGAAPEPAARALRDRAADGGGGPRPDRARDERRCGPPSPRGRPASPSCTPGSWAGSARSPTCASDARTRRRHLNDQRVALASRAARRDETAAGSGAHAAGAAGGRGPDRPTSPGRPRSSPSGAPAAKRSAAGCARA